MPKKLELARPANARGGVLIKHADLQTGLRAARLINDAKRRAAQIVQQAEQQAADYRRQGYLQGYGEGVLAGADAQVQALSDARRLTHGLASQLNAELKTQLQAILPQPEFALALADDWLKQQGEEAGDPIELHIPRAWQIAEHILRQRFAPLPEVRWCFHDEQHFVIQRGNSVYEFSPDAAAGELQRSILQRIRLDNLPAECQQISQDALALLWRHWQEGAHETEAETDLTQGDPQ